MEIQTIHYKINAKLKIEDVLDVYKSSGINRPLTDRSRIEQMFEHSNVVISAWHGFKLVGISRALTDYSYCCYLSDLAVHNNYQKQGIGKRLIEVTKEHIGDSCMLLLLAAPTAMEYYPKTGMEKADNAFLIKRIH